jgi:hypothetical protein
MTRSIERGFDYQIRRHDEARSFDEAEHHATSRCFTRYPEQRRHGQKVDEQ